MNLKKHFPIAVFAALGVYAILIVGGWNFGDTTSGRSRSQVEGKRPEDLLAKIKMGMTFDEVAAVIPLSTNLVGMQTAGSIWFHVPLDEQQTIRLRFSRPEEPDGNLHTITLNLAP